MVLIWESLKIGPPCKMPGKKYQKALYLCISTSPPLCTDIYISLFFSFLGGFSGLISCGVEPVQVRSWWSKEDITEKRKKRKLYTSLFDSLNRFFFFNFFTEKKDKLWWEEERDLLNDIGYIPVENYLCNEVLHGKHPVFIEKVETAVLWHFFFKREG